MISIACGNYYTIGLNKNERILLAGDVNENQYNIYNWEEIISVTCGNDHIVGLCRNEMFQLVQYIGNYFE